MNQDIHKIKCIENFIKKGLKNQEDTINKRIKELDDIVSKTTGAKQARAETEIITKTNQLKNLEIYIIKWNQKKKELRIY